MALMNQDYIEPERLAAGDVNLKITTGSHRFSMSPNILEHGYPAGAWHQNKNPS